MPSLLIGSKTTGALSWRRWVELKLVSQSLATLYSIPPPFFSPHFGMAAAACAGGSHRRNCMHLFLACRGSAEAEALERHTVFSTRVRAEALEQQKAEALKQQEAEALERQRFEVTASGSQSAEAATRPQASPVAKAPRSTHTFAHPP